jgi:hypothetical protein
MSVRRDINFIINAGGTGLLVEGAGKAREGALNFTEAPISKVAMVNSTCWGPLCEDY